MQGLERPPEAALEAMREHNIDRLLDDIRETDMTGVPIEAQAKGVGLMWKLKAFRKIAVLYKGQETEKLFFGTLEVTHLDAKFKGFEDEAEAIAWLTTE